MSSPKRIGDACLGVIMIVLNLALQSFVFIILTAQVLMIFGLLSEGLLTPVAVWIVFSAMLLTFNAITCCKYFRRRRANVYLGLVASTIFCVPRGIDLIITGLEAIEKSPVINGLSVRSARTEAYKSIIRIVSMQLFTVLAVIALVLSIRRADDLKTMRNSASRVGFELKGLDIARQQFARDKNKSPTDMVRFNDLAPYLENDTSGVSITLHALAKRSGLDEVGNSILIGTNEIVVGGQISDPIRVNPKTKEILKPATGGDEFWGPYR